jgi:flavin-dependent dehydrogenase
MTQRRRLDAFLVERAQEAGAEFRDGVRTTVESDTAVTIDGERIAVDAVIGADGANGITAKALGLGGAIVNGVALEGNLPYEQLPHDRWHGRLVLELGVVPGGYGWIFPKGEHVNVGVGGWQDEGPRLRAHLARLCREHQIPIDALMDIRGYRLPLRRPGAIAASGRTALVGDAAGLVDPVSGDGIYEALLSAKLAAAAALDVIAGRANDFARYAGELQNTLALSTATSWRAKLALERFPRLSFALLQAPHAWRALEQLMRADATHPAAIGGPGGVALRTAELLARLAGDPGRAFTPSA